jgi:hypothetical protein
MSVGTLTLRRDIGDEIYAIEQATITLTQQPHIQVPMPLVGGFTGAEGGGFGLEWEVLASEGPVQPWPDRRQDERYAPVVNAGYYWRRCEYDPTVVPLDLRSLIGRTLRLFVPSQNVPITTGGTLDTDRLVDGVYNNEAWFALLGSSERLSDNRITFLSLADESRMTLGWHGLLRNFVERGVDSEMIVEAEFTFASNLAAVP